MTRGHLDHLGLTPAGARRFEEILARYRPVRVRAGLQPVIIPRCLSDRHKPPLDTDPDLA